jgi:hypothetical protein
MFAGADKKVRPSLPSSPTRLTPSVTSPSEVTSWSFDRIPISH